MLVIKKWGVFGFAVCILAVVFTNSNCSYKFADVSVPDSIKTVKVNYIENRAQYVNPQLSPNLTDRLKQKIVNQTRLTQVNGDNADYDIKGEIRDYTVTTSGISNQQNALNRLTVGIHITLTNQRSSDPPQEFDVSRGFEFDARTSLQAAEARLLDDMIRNLTDDIFNRIFSNW